MESGPSMPLSKLASRLAPAFQNSISRISLLLVFPLSRIANFSFNIQWQAQSNSPIFLLLTGHPWQPLGFLSPLGTLFTACLVDL